MMLATHNLHKLGSRLCLEGAILETGLGMGAGRITILEGWARYRDGNRELVGCFSLADHHLPLEAGHITLVLRGNRFRLSVLNAIPDAPGRWSFLSIDQVARLTPRPDYPGESPYKPKLLS